MLSPPSLLEVVDLTGSAMMDAICEQSLMCRHHAGRMIPTFSPERTGNRELGTGNRTVCRDDRTRIPSTRPRAVGRTLMTSEASSTEPLYPPLD